MSCDCYFYDLSLYLGIEKISETAKVFGLEKVFRSNFSASEGIVPNKKWKKNNFQSEWTKSDTIVASIGQGFALSSPLQLAVMIARICTNGNLLNQLLLKIKNIIKNLKNSLFGRKSYSYVKKECIIL